MMQTYIVICDDMCAKIKICGDDRYPTRQEIEDALAIPAARLMNLFIKVAGSTLSSAGLCSPEMTIEVTDARVTNSVDESLKKHGAYCYKMAGGDAKIQH